MTAARPGYAGVLRENRRGDNCGKNKHRTQRFHFRHDVLRYGDSALNAIHSPTIVLMDCFSVPDGFGPRLPGLSECPA